MATYKVIQDIEAEDKLIGPLSLRQFIYAAIAALCAYLSFVVIAKGVAVLVVFFGPVMLFTGFFAIPWVGNQPTEVWALAKIRYFLKPRRRIWDQSGVKDLVNITVPKHIQKVYTNGLSQSEVYSRLTALTNTLDSRGWVTKNVNMNLYNPLRPTIIPNTDRLINVDNVPQEVSPIDVMASDDILDEVNNPIAKKLDQLVNLSSTTHRQKIISQLKKTISENPQNQDIMPTPDYWFLNQPLVTPKTSGKNVVFSDDHIVTVGSQNDISSSVNRALDPTPDEEALMGKIKLQKQRTQAKDYQHMKVIQPIEPQTNQGDKARSTPVQHTQPPVTSPSDSVKMSLAGRNDLNITTIGRIANRQDGQPEEVVISLHHRAS